MHDGLIKLGVRARKSAEEILQYQTVADIINDMLAAVAEEAKHQCLGASVCDESLASDGQVEDAPASSSSAGHAVNSEGKKAQQKV